MRDYHLSPVSESRYFMNCHHIKHFYIHTNVGPIANFIEILDSLESWICFWRKKLNNMDIVARALFDDYKIDQI